MDTSPRQNQPSTALSTWLLTAAAMAAFAANSILCRMALGRELIDAATFTSVRVTAGALTLGLILLPRWRHGGRAAGNWRASAMLFAYMACFSFAYLSLSAGTGALVLFGAVQLTMFISALRAGEYFAKLSWAGLALAIAGLIYLVSPGITAPDAGGALLMTVAGVAWGLYSLHGRGSGDPLESTANNFIYSVPLVLLVSLLFLSDFKASRAGLLLAIASGAAASGLGYAIWYAALKGLSGTRAATVQLSVPVVAAFGGVILLSESITPRLLIASAATLGGVALVLLQRARRDREN
ncbi:MAG: DMT family transporter [Xanthomonadales bacterium]|nr:DMT family transporter [Gammaproteobacteria bacterium]MBT8053401.1 DMT family transporter [Gammaproteobacteria bacterium]NND57452.1 DMT family transporter [Xanthomonadales bacterium]NNK52086.1 DMT family transporter [Xanthomonadales bacterium]